MKKFYSKKKKKWIPVALSLAIAGLLFSPALTLLGYGPDAVSGATSVPRSTTTAPAPKAASTATKPLIPAVQPAAAVGGTSYSSIPSTWAQNALRRASMVGLTFDSLMSQYNKPITRQEYAQLMVNLYEATTGKTVVPSVSRPFADTSSAAVAKANELGVANGVGESRFDPNGTLTRQEAAAMMYREWKLVHPDYQKPAISYQFQDSGNIAPWAKDAIQFMVHEGLMQGTGNNRIDPLGVATREEAVVLAMNNYEQSSAAAALVGNAADAVSKATQMSGQSVAVKADATSKATVRTGSTGEVSLWNFWEDDDDDWDDDEHDLEDYDGEDDHEDHDD